MGRTFSTKWEPGSPSWKTALVCGGSSVDHPAKMRFHSGDRNPFRIFLFGFPI
jgi:hypothetical protein